jgi:hypothetical protein
MKENRWKMGNLSEVTIRGGRADLVRDPALAY